MQVCLRPSITANVRDALHKHLSSISIPPSPLALPFLTSLPPYSGPDCTHRLRFGNASDAPCRCVRSRIKCVVFAASVSAFWSTWVDGIPVMQQPRVKNTSDARERAGCAVRYDRHTPNFTVQKVDAVLSSCCYYPGNDILCNEVSTFEQCLNWLNC